MYNHFNKINQKYLHNIGDKKKLYDLISNKINPKIKNKIILDIGSGGNIFYDYKLAKKTIALDVSAKALQSLKDEKIIKIISDARDMSKIKNSSVDVILIIFALHHVNGPNYASSLESLKKIIEESFKKLNIGGELIIFELTLTSFLFLIQKLFYKITYQILKFLKTDMVFFYKDSIIIENISPAPNITKSSMQDIKMSGWLDPLLGTFPGIIKIPSFLMPTSMKMFSVRKN
tara:strand:+ start:2582 stop:3277 length:696 start_codon:yes stop_codon:yes gene_type:complete